jgi:hypothetical protein
MNSAQKTLANIPMALFYPAMAACVGVAGLAGSLVGRALPGESPPRFACDVAMAACMMCMRCVHSGGVGALHSRGGDEDEELFHFLLDDMRS